MIDKPENVLIIFGDITVTENTCIVHRIDNVMIVPGGDLAIEIADTLVSEYDSYVIPHLFETVKFE